MNTFVKSVLTIPVESRTENGMKAQVSTMQAITDLFYKIGASRGKDITPLFERAYQENQDLAIRIAQWTRDVRGGAGERQLFRDILLHLEKLHPDALTKTKLLNNVAELGRWDDLLIFSTPLIKRQAYAIIADALLRGAAARVMLDQIDSMSESACEAELVKLEQRSK